LHQATSVTAKNKKDNHKKSRIDNSQNTDQGNKDDSINDEFNMDDETQNIPDEEDDDRSYVKRL